jgi:hypothetical protein
MDPALQKYAEILAAAKGFTPDIGDTIGGAFSSAEWTAIINTVNGQDLMTNLDNVAAAQKTVLGLP